MKVTKSLEEKHKSKWTVLLGQISTNHLPGPLQPEQSAVDYSTVKMKPSSCVAKSFHVFLQATLTSQLLLTQINATETEPEGLLEPQQGITLVSIVFICVIIVIGLACCLNHWMKHRRSKQVPSIKKLNQPDLTEAEDDKQVARSGGEADTEKGARIAFIDGNSTVETRREETARSLLSHLTVDEDDLKRMRQFAPKPSRLRVRPIQSPPLIVTQLMTMPSHVTEISSVEHESSLVDF